MLEHFDNALIDNMVYVPTYDKSKAIIKYYDYVNVSECFKKYDRFFYFYKQRKLISSALNYYDPKDLDIIHAYTLFTDGNVAMELSKMWKKPYVVAIRNTDLNLFFNKLFYLRKHGVKILRNAKAVFFLSPVYRDIVINMYVPKKLRQDILEKSFIIPNGINDYWLNHKWNKDLIAVENRIKNRIIKFLYVGVIDKNKNVELTLKALKKMNMIGWKCELTIVGKIVDKTLFRRLKNNYIFQYVAPKQKEELIDYYREADIFVMPSHTETFGLVYAEAMSQGLPVLYTRGQGFDGHFGVGEIGYPVNDHDPDDLVNSINLIVKDYSNISSRCINASDKFDWTNICKEYQDIYSNIINEG